MPSGILTIISRLLDIDYEHKVCVQAFPQKHCAVLALPNVTAVNSLGDFHIEADRLVFIDRNHHFFVSCSVSQTLLVDGYISDWSRTFWDTMNHHSPHNMSTIISDSDFSNSFSAKKADLFPVLPSTIRESRYGDNVR
jgi:hypothetical protein